MFEQKNGSENAYLVSKHKICLLILSIIVANSLQILFITCFLVKV